ncbi:pancreatic lipase-related protein 2-like [Glandiceps talaboti]
MKVFCLLAIAVTILVREGFAETVCYDDPWGLGCFTNDPPYDNVPNLPEDPDTVGTGFYLYTQRNKGNTEGQIIDRFNPDSLHNSNFDRTKLTKFLIHGWGSNGLSGWPMSMKDEFLENDDHNVFSVDWEDGAGAFYFQSVANTQIVGAEINALLEFIDAELGYSYDMVHIIGHSLGGHCSGHAGKYTGGAIARISALDPAGPNFEGQDPAVRIDPTDAKFVDVIHTDANEGLTGLGIHMECGHVDFYPNEGTDQPGCTGPTGSCSHSRAHHFYSESINSECKFTAYPCTAEFWASCNSCSPPCNNMGYTAFDDGSDTIERYYLETASDSPYCLG